MLINIKSQQEFIIKMVSLDINSLYHATIGYVWLEVFVSHRRVKYFVWGIGWSQLGREQYFR